MILLVLAGGWVLLAALVSPIGTGALTRFPPRLQAAIAFLACACLGAIPAAVASILLAQDLSGPGPLMRRCGSLLSSVVSDPLTHPHVTLALVTLLAAPVGLGIGMLRAWRSQAASRRLAVAEPGPLVTAPSAELFAFTAGLVFPRVVLSEGLLRSAPAIWQRIVVAHEEAHRRGRHPLAIFVVESLARGLPLLPLRWGADSVRLALEFVADEQATAEVGSREAVAAAIAGLALAPATSAASFEGSEVWRCRRLVCPPAAPGSLVAIALALLSVVLGLTAVAAGHALHCAWASVDALSVRQCGIR